MIPGRARTQSSGSQIPLAQLAMPLWDDIDGLSRRTAVAKSRDGKNSLGAIGDYIYRDVAAVASIVRDLHRVIAAQALLSLLRLIYGEMAFAAFEILMWATGSLETVPYLASLITGAKLALAVIAVGKFLVISIDDIQSSLRWNRRMEESVELHTSLRQREAWSGPGIQHNASVNSASPQSHKRRIRRQRDVATHSQGSTWVQSNLDL